MVDLNAPKSVLESARHIDRVHILFYTIALKTQATKAVATRAAAAAAVAARGFEAPSGLPRVDLAS